MFKLAIFEDERIILNSLCNTIDWSAYGCTLVCSSHIGECAIPLISEHHPHIIITDIEMNNANGLDICDWVQTNHPTVQKIIITGFGTVDYAKRAIKCEVVDFILKPIDRVELIGAVKKAIANLEEQRRATERLSTLDLTIHSYKSQLIEKFLLEIADGRQCDGEILYSRVNELGMELHGYFCLAIEVSSVADEPIGNDVATVLDSELQFQTLLDSFLVSYYCYFNHRYYCICQIDEKEEQPVSQLETYNAIHQSVVQLQERFITVFHIPLYMCYSDIYQYPHEIYDCFRQTNLLLEQKFFVRKGAIVHNDGTQQRCVVPVKQQLDDLFMPIMVEVISGNRSEAFQLFEHMRLLMCELSEEETKYKCIEFFISLKNHIAPYGIKLDELLTTDKLMDAFSKQYHFDDIIQVLTGILEQCIGQRIAKMQTGNSISEKILSYIGEHFEDALTVKSIADTFNYNAKYLSMLVKKETGITISEMILSARIEKAKELITTSNLKTYMIAERVGIPDAKYFSQLFHKETGMTPKEFRRKFG